MDVCDFVLTFATLDRANPRKNICAFLIDRDTPGLKLRPYKNKLGFRPLSSGDIFLDDCRVPASNRLGEEGQGLSIALCAVTNGRLGVAARALGIAEACYEASVKYARERIVFDQPIGRFQLVQSMITDMLVGIEGARAATYRLAWMRSQGKPGTRVQASLAKMMASDTAPDGRHSRGADSWSVRLPWRIGCEPTFSRCEGFPDCRRTESTSPQHCRRVCPGLSRWIEVGSSRSQNLTFDRAFVPRMTPE